LSNPSKQLEPQGCFLQPLGALHRSCSGW
jgi:hypothetical protein